MFFKTTAECGIDWLGDNEQLWSWRMLKRVVCYLYLAKPMTKRIDRRLYGKLGLHDGSFRQWSSLLAEF